MEPPVESVAVKLGVGADTASTCRMASVPLVASSVAGNNNDVRLTGMVKVPWLAGTEHWRPTVCTTYVAALAGVPLTGACVLTTMLTLPDPPPVQLRVSGCVRLMVLMPPKLTTAKEPGKLSDALNGPMALDPLPVRV